MNGTQHFALMIGILSLHTVLCLLIARRPIAQDQHYHDFADSRSFHGIPNFFDVVSNLIFLATGLAGFAVFARIRLGMTDHESFLPVVALCIGALLTAAGSAFYHWNPSDRSLIFDRLGMVVVFAAFVTILTAHFDISYPALLFATLLTLGVGSVVFWVHAGDLRPYAIFQTLPLVFFVVGTFLFPRTHTRDAMLWLVSIGYVLAKVCESFDRRIYNLGGVVSGHTLKHLIAGASLLITIGWLAARQPIL